MPVSGSLQQLDAEVLLERGAARLARHLVHRLRNSLSGVRCFLELTADGGGPELEPFRLEADRVVDALADLASRFLALSRPPEGRVELGHEVDSVLKLLRDVGAAQTCQLEVRLADGEVPASRVLAMRGLLLWALLAQLEAQAHAVVVDARVLAGDVRLTLSSGELVVPPELLVIEQAKITAVGSTLRIQIENPTLGSL